MQTQNLLQELSTKLIYVKYDLPVRQSSHSNRIKYSFNKLLNTLRIWRVNFFIIMFFWLNESSTEDDLKKPIVNWLFDLTLKTNKHPKASDYFCMINEAKKGL